MRINHAEYVVFPNPPLGSAERAIFPTLHPKQVSVYGSWIQKSQLAGVRLDPKDDTVRQSHQLPPEEVATTVQSQAGPSHHEVGSDQ